MTAHQDSRFPTDERTLLVNLLSPNHTLFQKSWQYFYKKYYPPVQRFVMNNNGSENSARDVFHDGLISFIKNVSTGVFRGDSSIGTYLVGICKKRWLKELESVRKEEAALSIVAGNLYSDSNDEDQSRVIGLGLILAEMKPDCQDLIRYSYFKGLSNEQLQVHFNVKSIDVIKVKKHRCLKYFKRLYMERIM